MANLESMGPPWAHRAMGDDNLGSRGGGGPRNCFGGTVKLRPPWWAVVGAGVAAYWIAYFVPPVSWWLKPGIMIIPDVQVGEQVFLQYSREIRRPFDGDWRATLRSFQEEEQGWKTVCTATGGALYVPDAVLPRPLTLEWWTEGACSSDVLPAGYAQITTVWLIHTPLPGTRRVVTHSNVFRVFEEEDDR